MIVRHNISAIREDYDAVLMALHEEITAYRADPYQKMRAPPEMIAQLLTEAALLESELTLAIATAEEAALGQETLL